MTEEKDLNYPNLGPSDLPLPLDCVYIIPHSLGKQGKTLLDVLVI
jgi:hypothetical protein